jgi:two-component system chemotaxis response regulator CheY
MAKILIVDDSAFARNNLKIIVESGGHEVTGMAESSEQALELFSVLNPDIVMLDYLMSGQSGVEALREMIRQKPLTKVIMVSGIRDSAIEEEALATGAKVFIRKPFTPEKLFNAIDQVMAIE